MSDDLATTLVTQTVSLDEELSNRIRRLASKALDIAEFAMDHGDPKTKSELANTLLKAMAQEVKRREVGEEVEELRGALAELTKAVVGYNPGVLELESEEVEVKEDGK